MRGARATACLVGVVVTVSLVPVVHRSPIGTHGGGDVRALVLEATAALALILVAAVSRSVVPAVVLAVAGTLWLVPEIAGAAGVPLGVRTLAAASGPVLAALLIFALVLRVGVAVRGVRPAMLVAVTGAAVAAATRVLLVDPFYDASCWRTCHHNPLTVAGPGVGDAIELVGLLALTAGAAWAAGVELAARQTARWRPVGADVAGWVAAAGLALAPVLGLDARPSPENVGSATLFVAVNAAILAWPAWLGWEEWRRWRLEVRLTQVVDLLKAGSDPGSMTTSLRQAVRDPGLRLGYWAPARRAYVDDEGRLVPRPGPVATHERATTITRHGQTIAVIVHTSRIDGRLLERALSPALRLVLENAQLRAASLAELAELMSSRTRVVERAEVERQRLERNLHDGAQQRAVSLALLVRMAARSTALTPRAAARAEVLARTLVEELRRVARGIYPAVLADAGLSGAVADLAESSTDLPVLVGDLPGVRCQGAVETTAYLVVRAGIADARDRGAACVTVEGRHSHDTLRLTVQDDGTSQPASATPHLADQVGALGGSVTTSESQGLHRLEVMLPCRS